MTTEFKNKTLDKILKSKHKQSNKIFDHKDNSFLLSNREIATVLKVSPSTIDQMFRKLKAADLVREVQTISGKAVRMLSPSVYWNNHVLEKPFAEAIYELGSFGAASKWSDDCEYLAGFIDPLTGTIDSSAKAAKKIDKIIMYREGYTKCDRTKRRDKFNPARSLIERASMCISRCCDDTPREKNFIILVNAGSKHDYSGVRHAA